MIIKYIIILIIYNYIINKYNFFGIFINEIDSFKPIDSNIITIYYIPYDEKIVYNLIKTIIYNRLI